MSNSTQDFTKVSGTIVFCKMSEPAKAFVKPGAPKKPDEWKCSIVITDKAYKKELEKYGKSLDTLLSIKEVDSADFEDKYKCSLPEGAGDEVWVFTLRKSTELGKTGRPVPLQYQPKVFEKIKNTMVEITSTKLPGNGSFGTLSIDKFDRSAGGSSLFLKNLLVTSMVEYVKQDSEYEAGSEFGDDSASDGNGGSAKVPAKAVNKVAPKAKAAPRPQDDEDDSDLPFATNSAYFDQTTSKERKMARYDF